MHHDICVVDKIWGHHCFGIGGYAFLFDNTQSDKEQYRNCKGIMQIFRGWKDEYRF